MAMTGSGSREYFFSSSICLSGEQRRRTVAKIFEIERQVR